MSAYEAAAAAEAAEVTAHPIEVDGYLLDPDTGEVLGLARSDAFEIRDVASAEWLLERMSAEDAEVAALSARLNALSQNLSVMIRDHQNRRAYLQFRFGPELEHFARENLPRGKKTWTCPYGSVSFRASATSIKVRDEERALAWAAENCPEAIKTTSKVLISIVTDAAQAPLLADPAVADVNGFEVIPAGETVSIKTGVK